MATRYSRIFIEQGLCHGFKNKKCEDHSRACKMGGEKSGTDSQSCNGSCDIPSGAENSVSVRTAVAVFSTAALSYQANAQ
jgi:hypothetical protein